MKVVELLGPSTGGIRRHVAVLASLLADRGWPVTVAAPRGVLDGLDTGRSTRSDVDVPSSYAPAGILRARSELRAVLRRDQPDIVHAHGLKAGWLAVVSRPRVPIVLTVHNVVLDAVAGRGAALQRRIERALVGRVEHIIAVSPEIAQHFGGHVRPDRIDVVLPASPAPVPKRPAQEVRAAHGVATDALLVVVAARLHPQKDLGVFVRAWAAVTAEQPDATAVIVGEGPSRDELDALIDELGVGGTLQLAGPSEHAVDELAAADLVVLSSRWEGAPLVVAEAMQLGRPIVSTRVGVVPEMVGEGGTIVEVGDVEALAGAMLRYLASADLREEAGRIGLERGTVIYGAPALVDEVARIYQEAVLRYRSGSSPATKSLANLSGGGRSHWRRPS